MRAGGEQRACDVRCAECKGSDSVQRVVMTTVQNEDDLFGEWTIVWRRHTLHPTLNTQACVQVVVGELFSIDVFLWLDLCYYWDIVPDIWFYMKNKIRL